MSVVWHDAETWRPTPGGPVWTERFRGKLFDSYLGESSHYTQNHALYLFLRIYLNPVANQATALDSKKRSFPARNWTGVEWAHFKEQFERQSKAWNNKFWLIPPGHFSIKDKNKLRPNIMCYLITDVAQSPSNAHRVVNVVNLDVDAIKKRRGANPTSGTFKSNARLYDSLDIKKRTNTYEDDRGEVHTVENYSTIAHELGHAIGLPHIGVLKSRPQCTFAVTLKKLGVTNVSSHLSRGANAEVCYGEFDNLGLAENIMGLGTKFEKINAGPWVKTVAIHTNTLERDWRVRLGGIGPQTVR